MLAFPSAVGWGKETVGGRGGQVLHVTNLNDSGAGSFRQAVETTNGPRIVVFDVAGWIELESEVHLTNDYCTIAAQTAPGGGIGLRVASGGSSENRAFINITGSQFIIRGLRSRPGIWYPGQSVQVYYCINIGDGSTDIIIDRCSFSWADDTAFQTWGDVRRVTLQNSIISESPAEAINMGAGIAGNPLKRGTNISVIGNLITSNRRRNPKIHGYASEVKNNLVYNYKGGEYIAEGATCDIEGNLYLAGPNTGMANKTFVLQEPLPGMQIFVLDNITPERPDNTGDEWLIIEGDDEQIYRSLTRVGSSDYVPYEVELVQETVLATVGAIPEDTIDARLKAEVISLAGAWIDDESDVGGWDTLAAGTPPLDTDGDGMPDIWEIDRGLDPLVDDANEDANGDGYDNIEEYINELLDGVMTFENIEATPTFQAISLKWAPSGASGEEATVEYRVAGANVWRDGLPLWYDSRSMSYRGSIVNLLPGTQYEIRLTIEDVATEALEVTTWNEHFPIAETVYLQDSSSSALVIDRAGSSSGYILYTGRPGGPRPTIDVNDLADYAVDISGASSHIILRDVLITGSSLENIFLRGTAHDIVIEDCELTDWGVADANGGVGNNDDGAIGTEEGGSAYRIIIQRNRIHDPRGYATSWANGEPGGPQGIRLKDTAGNNVIRYNEIYSTTGRYFETGMRGGTRQSNLGFPGRNSDIYGNFISHVWNQAIACDGGGENVRVFGNYMEDVYIMLSASPISMGPTYFFRNVAGRSRALDTTEDSDHYDRGALLEVGDIGGYGSGRIYVIHNSTLTLEPEAGKVNKLGCRGGIMRASGLFAYQIYSRNNVFSRHNGISTVYTDGTNSCTTSLDYDLYNASLGNNCAITPHEANGIPLGDGVWPAFDDENNFFDGRSGTFALLDDGVGEGEIIPNFNDEAAAPDMGAYQTGSEPMRFGLEGAKALFAGPLGRTVRSGRRPVITS